MRLGITPTYISLYGLKNGAKKMREHGYSCLDYQGFVNTETEFFMLDENEFKKQLEEESKILESEGITVNQVHGPWRYPPRDYLPEDREERFNSMSKGIRGCSYLGGKYFVIHPIMPFGANSSENAEEVIEMTLDFMSRLARVGEENNVIVCLENMPFPLHPVATAAQILNIVKNVGSDYFKVCLDTGHCLVCKESPAEAVRLLGKDYLATLHVHDNDGERDLHLLPGKGIADWWDFSDSLEEIGFDGVLSLETNVSEKLPKNQLETSQKQLAAFAAFLAKNV